MQPQIVEIIVVMLLDGDDEDIFGTQESRIQCITLGRQGSLDLRQADTASDTLARVVILSGKVRFQPGGKERARGKKKEARSRVPLQGFRHSASCHSGSRERCATVSKKTVVQKVKLIPGDRLGEACCLYTVIAAWNQEPLFKRVPCLQQHRHDFPKR